MFSINRTFQALLTIAVLLGLSATSLADIYADKDFSLRFSAALTRFATYGDVAGVGGASAGSRWSSSANPASIAWLDIEGPLQIYAAPQYSRVSFNNGTTLDVFAESITWDADDWGTFLVAAAQVNSNRATDHNMGLDFRFSGDIIQGQWAKKLTDAWAVGFNLGYTKSTCRGDLGPFAIYKSNSDTYNVRVGTLHKLSAEGKLLGGLVLDYGWSRDRTSYYPLVDPETNVYDNTRQFLVRPGITYEYMKDCAIYLDYQFGTFWNNTGTLNVHRIYAGVEHDIFGNWIFARTGTCIDPGEQAYSYTCGLGFYPAKWLSFDVAYQYDMFPELIQEFGRSHTLNCSLSVTF